MSLLCQFGGDQIGRSLFDAAHGWSHMASADEGPGADNYLLHWRKRRNLSLTALSTRIAATGSQFVSPKTLNRWEKGETPLPEWAITEVARALKVSEEELLHGPREADPRLPVNVSGAYTGLDVEIADRVITMGYTSWFASRPESARNAVQSIVPWLETMQRRAVHAPQAREGKRLLARGYELLGALALDRLDNEEAIQQFRRALTLSEELRDPDLTAAHTTQLGDAYRRKGEKETALGFMEAALANARAAERSTRGYILEMLAYTYADAGNEPAFRRHIEEATDLLGHSGEGQGAGQRDFIPFEVLEIYRKALRDFGHPVQALGFLDQAERALVSRPNVPRWHAVLTISKAQALCDAGELDAGVQLAIQGLLLAHACQSPRQMNRVHKLLRKLEASDMASSPALVPLREVIHDIYAGNRSPLEWLPQHTM
jgi:tetratricopeptide (TPR) repeat protein